MIAFDLCCENDHTFEVWFSDSKEYERQKDQGLLVCPVCGSHEVRKILSPVALHKGTKNRPVAPAGEGQDSHKALEQFLYKIYKVIEKNTEDVGTDFAKEALKMHYGVTEPRNIRGVATESEEKLLKEEGISFMKIPVPRKSKKEH